ncbi:hypothetical protein J1605_020833 [Eschrichtius robustus]|uniref:SOS1/NGEF-like PH domain-containing protein n=1 Tax=Eschrichtius robustus TaxID=9764 RepID=A0AB34HFW6_ESCRO|nr:hypothetical protein J1605_020833 [Eschrichtius robustus]
MTSEHLPWQCELVGSLKALHKLVDSSQLTADLEGSFPYSHSAWICFRRKLEPFTSNCKEAIVFLQNSVHSLNTHRTPSTAQEVAELIGKHRAVMKHVLEDARLVALRLEGGTVLARLRREEHGAGQDCQDTIEAACRLYNQVDEEVHRLVLASNRCLQELESLQALKKLQERGHQSGLQRGGDQITSWFEKEREIPRAFGAALSGEHKAVAGVPGSPGQADAIPSERAAADGRGLARRKEGTQAFRRSLSAKASLAEQREGELARQACGSKFCETVGGWTLRCSQCLEHLDPELVTEGLTRRRRAAVQSFPRTSVVVVGPGSHWVLPRGQTLWLQSRQTRRHWQEALGEAAPGPGTLPLGWSPPKHELAQGPEGQPLEPAWTPPADPEARAGEWAGQAAVCGQEGLEVASTTVASEKQPPLRPRAESPRLPRNRSLSSPSRIHPSEEDGKGRAGSRSTAFPAEGSLLRACESSSCQSCPLKAVLESNRLEERLQYQCEDSSGVKRLDITRPRRQETTGESAFVRLPSVYTAFITLEFQSLVSSEAGIALTKCFLRLAAARPECPLGSLSFSSRPQHVMAEMISTERQNGKDGPAPGPPREAQRHFRELGDALRLPPRVLPGLERCRHRPWAVGHAFLRYEEQLGMSALYSKNKPRADTLLCSHGNAFFRDKPRELGDKMDLASYLLKPAQRQELGELRAAKDAVRFQLRHGDDLLALDAVRGCDVDLKAQGRLRCQDEFLVCCRRKKHLRRVFPFEDLIPFSKTQKVDGGHDVYTYKQSFKMAEIGMTENVGDSGLRFEIWFRRRRKSQDAYVLQASSAEVKTAWTDVIGKILWRQALRSRELRTQELVSTGIGGKPFMDVKPSNAAISDRAVSYTGGEQVSGHSPGSRSAPPTQTQVPQCAGPHGPTRRAGRAAAPQQHTLLQRPVLLRPGAPHAPTSPARCPCAYGVHTCIEEDELEQEAERQPPLRERMRALEPAHVFIISPDFIGASAQSVGRELLRAGSGHGEHAPSPAQSHHALLDTSLRLQDRGRLPSGLRQPLVSPESGETGISESSHRTSGDSGPSLHGPSLPLAELSSDEDRQGVSLALPARGSQQQPGGDQCITTVNASRAQMHRGRNGTPGGGGGPGLAAPPSPPRDFPREEAASSEKTLPPCSPDGTAGTVTPPHSRLSGGVPCVRRTSRAPHAPRARPTHPTRAPRTPRAHHVRHCPGPSLHSREGLRLRTCAQIRLKACR